MCNVLLHPFPDHCNTPQRCVLRFVHCSLTTPQHTATKASILCLLHTTPTYSSTLRDTVTKGSVACFVHTSPHTLQHTATKACVLSFWHLEQTAIHCNTRQHTATKGYVPCFLHTSLTAGWMYGYHAEDMRGKQWCSICMHAHVQSVRV